MRMVNSTVVVTWGKPTFFSHLYAGITPKHLPNTNLKMWGFFLQNFMPEKLGQSSRVNQAVCPLLQEAASQSSRKKEVNAFKWVKLLKMRNWEFMAIFLLSGQKKKKSQGTYSKGLYQFFHYKVAQIYQYRVISYSKVKKPISPRYV